MIFLFKFFFYVYLFLKYFLYKISFRWKNPNFLPFFCKYFQIFYVFIFLNTFYIFNVLKKVSKFNFRQLCWKMCLVNYLQVFHSASFWFNFMIFHDFVFFGSFQLGMGGGVLNLKFKENVFNVNQKCSFDPDTCWIFDFDSPELDPDFPKFYTVSFWFLDQHFEFFGPKIEIFEYKFWSLSRNFDGFFVIEIL